ncbi:MAG: hypothetical protein ABSA79_09105 [Candidatus Bathyarchaeia archaeon]
MQSIDVDSLRSTIIREILLSINSNPDSANIEITLEKALHSSRQKSYYEFFFHGGFDRSVGAYETLIIDNTTGESLSALIPTTIFLRVKAPRQSPKVHVRISREGMAFFSKITRIHVWGAKGNSHLTIFASLNPEKLLSH